MTQIHVLMRNFCPYAAEFTVKKYLSRIILYVTKTKNVLECLAQNFPVNTARKPKLVQNETERSILLINISSERR